MTRRLLPLLTAAALLATAPAATAQLPGGLVSDNVEFVDNFARHTDSSGAKLLDGYFYITTERDLSIYDVKDPESPALVGNVVLDTPGEPTQTEEDPDTNGKILAISNTDLQIYDVSDKTSPKLLSTLAGVDEHTFSCVLDCTYLYGSEGRIIDLRDPKNPKEAGNWAEPLEADSHDVTEISPGILVTSTNPILYLDARADPLKPKQLASAPAPGFVHATLWPHQGTDDFLLAGGENIGPACSDNASSSFMTFDTRGWASSQAFKLVSEFKMSTGTIVDGRNPETTWCVHWFQEHPTYRSGGLVAIAWYEHGVRFLKVSTDGKIEEIGYFLPYNGQTSDVEWVTDKIIYTADYVRGFDILKFTGDVPQGKPAPGALPGTTAPGAAKPPSAGAPAPAVGGPSFSKLVSLPRACASAKKFKVRIRTYRKDPVVSATLFLNGKRAGTAKGAKLRKGLKAKRLPRKKRFAIQVEVRTKSGHTSAGQRIYPKGCKKR